MALGGRWWTGCAERTVSDIIAAKPEVVRDFYVDLRNIRHVHPLVVEVRTVDRREGVDGYVQTYRVRDRIPLGPVRMPIVYTARLDVPRSGDVRTEARQFPWVRLDGVVSFDEVEGGTRITKRLRIEAPRPLAAMTVRQAVAAHVEMLAGIRRTFASRS
jgi:hypothetical protein